MKKVVDIHKETAGKLEAVTTHEIEKKGERLDQDSMAISLSAYKSMQTVYSTRAQAMRSYAQEIPEKVIEPLMSFLDAAHKRKEELRKVESKLKSSCNDVTSSVNKQRKRALKDWESLRKCNFKDYLLGAPAEMDSRGKKKEASFMKLLDKTAASFQNIESLVKESEGLSKEYVKLVGALKALDEARMLKQQELTRVIVEIETQCQQLVAKKQDLLLAVSERASPETQMEDWSRRKGLVVRDQPLTFGLPVTAELLQDTTRRRALCSSLQSSAGDAIKQTDALQETRRYSLFVPGSGNSNETTVATSISSASVSVVSPAITGSASTSPHNKASFSSTNTSPTSTLVVQSASPVQSKTANLTISFEGHEKPTISKISSSPSVAVANHQANDKRGQEVSETMSVAPTSVAKPILLSSALSAHNKAGSALSSPSLSPINASKASPRPLPLPFFLSLIP